MNRMWNGRGTLAAAVAAALVSGGAALGCPDTNGDDVVDVQDLTNVILDWGSDGSGNNGDANGDGVVDVQDLTDVILAWGPFECPSKGCEVGPGAPANDCCETATVVVGDTSLPFDTTNANTDGPQDPDEPCGSNTDGIWKDVWYSYTPAADGLLTVGNCNAGDYDSKMFIYEVPEGAGACDEETLLANTVACNDDCPDDGVIFTSEIEVVVTGGVEYLIRMGGYSDSDESEAAFGTGTITFDLLSNNDTCVVAEPISPGDTVTSSTADATIDETALSCGGGVPTAPGRWYKTVGDGTTYTVALCQTGIDFDTRLSILCGPCDDLACAVDDANNNCGGAGLFNETTSFCTLADVTYYILVHGQNAATGTYALELSSDATPCADPACPPALGVCCVDFACVGVTELPDCAAQGGLWFEDEDCGTFDCGALPVNDACEDAIDIGTGDVAVDYDNTYATAGPDGAPNVTCDKFGDTPGCRKDLWYLYTVSGGDSIVQIDTCAGSVDTKLVVYDYDTCPVGDLSDIACNDDDTNNNPNYCGGGTFSAIQIPVVEGQTLLIRVGSWGTDDNEGPSGASTLSVTVVPPSP